MLNGVKDCSPLLEDDDREARAALPFAADDPDVAGTGPPAIRLPVVASVAMSTLGQGGVRAAVCQFHAVTAKPKFYRSVGGECARHEATTRGRGGGRMSASASS